MTVLLRDPKDKSAAKALAYVRGLQKRAENDGNSTGKSNMLDAPRTPRRADPAIVPTTFSEERAMCYSKFASLGILILSLPSSESLRALESDSPSSVAVAKLNQWRNSTASLFLWAIGPTQPSDLKSHAGQDGVSSVKGATDNAITAFDSAIRSDPGYSVPYMGRGLCRVERGQTGRSACRLQNKRYGWIPRTHTRTFCAG